jgi:hypothetical protein
MAIVASLFDTYDMAREALDALAEADFSQLQTEIYEPPGEEGESLDPDDRSAIHTERIAGAPYNVDLFGGLEERDQTDFMRNVQMGKILIVAYAEDERTDELETILREHGGQLEAE